MEIAVKKTINGVMIPLLPDNKDWKNRIEIRSETSNRLYVVAQNKKTNNWGCSCPGWIIHRKCKHLTGLKNIINIIEINSNSKKEIE